jgi:Cu+-exporting ATPase
MNRILRKAVVFTFVVGLSTYVSKTLWACGGGEHSGHESGGQTVQTKTEVKGEKAGAVKDPVCGMEVSDIKKAPSEEYKGKVYYFCSENCKKTFKKSPKSFIEGLIKR